MEKSIAHLGLELGCSGSFLWEVEPENFAHRIMDALKRYSRFLKSSGLVTSHSEGLEKIARAAAFPNWHACQVVLQGVIHDFDPEVYWPRPQGGRERINPLIPALPFLAEVSVDCPPTSAELEGLKKAASQLEKTTGGDFAKILDMIANMNGADSWPLLLNRKPEDTKEPLYGFQVTADGRGRFLVSSACSALIEKQDELFQDYDLRPKYQQEQFGRQLKVVLAAQPTFLEGLLAKAEIMGDTIEMWDQQAIVYAEAIRAADVLIPTGFKGRVSWGDMSNRFFHRLLYGAMLCNSRLGNFRKAIALARRQLRLNKEDNLGVRLWLPILLSADSQLIAVDKACAKMRPRDGYTDAGIELVKAICHFANKRLQESAESLYLSLFLYPPLRYVMSRDFAALNETLNDKQALRPILPDPQTLVDQYVTALIEIPELEHTFDAWMGRKEVAAAEVHLAKEFHAAWGVQGANMERWKSEIAKHAAQLSISAIIFR